MLQQFIENTIKTHIVYADDAINSSGYLIKCRILLIENKSSYSFFF